ncbi:YbdD/YjiX family protein [Motilibacter deserti]|uniref:YbdD/YjiX family protein n=1 Tax=Motilibacter deserti TaxID=2714956 RepID=A0ABX0GXN7_9ACTN|nr:YbdD/YjiX family protein [Motilibacter deserti]NHC15709.1 YbdD/YjiX family protein [Motilibacter deserti]
MNAASLIDHGSRAWRGVVWYLREWSGEARWDRYLEDCRRHGHAPVARREFERGRAAAAERGGPRCC